MPWKTVKLKAGEDLGLDQEDLEIKIIPLAWLPSEVSVAAMEVASISEDENPEAPGITEEESARRAKSLMTSRTESLSALMPNIIWSWNLKGDGGELVPPPRVLVEQGDQALLKKYALPLGLLQYILEKAMGERADEIPEASGPQSSDTSQTGRPSLSVVPAEETSAE